MSITFGVQTWLEGARSTDLFETWRLLDDLRFETAWLNDHLLPVSLTDMTTCLDSWTMLAALARETKRIRLGILVSPTTYRNPVFLAKAGASVDQISNG